jgi:hypothetical protein
MLPVRSTKIPKVEESIEFLSINAPGIVNMEAHSHRGNRKPKNPVSELEHLEARSEPAKGRLEEVTNRIRVQLEDASAKKNHQPEKTIEDGGEPDKPKKLN